MSIAGGYYRAVEAAAQFWMDVVQVFTKNNNQWRAKEITDAEAERFKQELAETKMQQPLSHASYLINLGSANDELWQKSVDGMVVELERAGQLGIPYVVVHPGAANDEPVEEAIERVARGLNEIQASVSPAAAKVLLENTSGQGSCLGRRFEELGAIIGQTRQPERIGVCIDTCHCFAAGYDLRTEAAYRETFEQLDQLLGLARINAFHLNDSKKPLGSRVDRHEHIGRGQLGEEPFRLLLNDPRFAAIPMYLETPKEGDCEGEHRDAVNMRTLRGLVAR